MARDDRDQRGGHQASTRKCPGCEYCSKAYDRAKQKRSWRKEETPDETR